jgi:uncharacterized membrane protein
MRNKSFFLLLVLIILLIANPASAVVRYNVIDLGALPGYEVSRAWSINNNGQIVGWVSSDSSFLDRAVLFDATGGGNNTDLGTLGGVSGEALSINDSGQIVGCAENDASPSVFCATIFDAGGGVNTGLGEGLANSINDNGQIVGYERNVGVSHAVLFDTTGQGNNTDFGALDGYLYSEAYSINNNGYVVGYAFNVLTPWEGDSRAVLFDPTYQGNNINLGTLGGQSSMALSINDNGQIVGRAGINPNNDSRWFDHAAMFDPNDSGNNIDLGTLDEFDGSVAVSINNKGQIVGQAWKVQDDYFTNLRAVLFDPTGCGNNIDLNDSINPDIGWELGGAICINDNGWIVGFGTNPDGYLRAFLLIPVPEPATILLLALGVEFLRKINR